MVGSTDRFFSTVTWVFPPALPIIFSFTGTISLIRLGKNQVFGSSTEKIHLAGKIDTVCFDKTGTLTSNRLKIKDEWPTKAILQPLQATCHHLSLVENELVGDMLDYEMFQASGAEYVAQEKHFSVWCSGKQIEILRIFDFSSERQMMSVLV